MSLLPSSTRPCWSSSRRAARRRDSLAVSSLHATHQSPEVDHEGFRHLIGAGGHDAHAPCAARFRPRDAHVGEHIGDSDGLGGGEYSRLGSQCYGIVRRGCSIPKRGMGVDVVVLQLDGLARVVDARVASHTRVDANDDLAQGRSSTTLSFACVAASSKGVPHVAPHGRCCSIRSPDGCSQRFPRAAARSVASPTIWRPRRAIA